MLKFIFWSLLCINGVLFAYGRGYLGNFKGNEREPARMKNQVNADKLALVPAAAAAGAPSRPSRRRPPAPNRRRAPRRRWSPASRSATSTPQEARRFDNRIAALGLAQQPVRQNVAGHRGHAATWCTSRRRPAREAADRKAEELKNLGVTNYYVMPDNTPMKWAISLGVFKSENAAQDLAGRAEQAGRARRAHQRRAAPR